MMRKADYFDLVDAWWQMRLTMTETCDVESESGAGWHSSVFERVLDQCGWTVAEWNEAVAEDARNRQT